MRKVMLLAAMLAMVLAAAAPAFAQIGGDQGPAAGDDAIQAGDNVQYSAVCQNVIGAIGDVSGTQVATADAVAVDDSAAAAEVAQELDVSVEVVNECLNAFATVTATHTATATTAAHVQYGTPTATATGTAAAAATATALPETGGASVPSAIALGAGALLVAGGLLARRIVR